MAAADGSDERAAKGAMVFACAAVEAVTVREQVEVEEADAYDENGREGSNRWREVVDAAAVKQRRRKGRLMGNGVPCEAGFSAELRSRSSEMLKGLNRSECEMPASDLTRAFRSAANAGGKKAAKPRAAEKKAPFAIEAADVVRGAPMPSPRVPWWGALRGTTGE